MTINRRDVLFSGGTAAAAVAAGVTAPTPTLAQAQLPATWDHTADVVVIGSGACGMPAAIVAKEAGSSVIMVEAQPHVGGHAICSGGNLPLGGGNSYQKKYGIEDSPDLFFRDLTDWSAVEPNGSAPYRYNDHEIIRAFVDNSVATFEFLLAHGVKVIEKGPDRRGGHEVGMSVLRTMHCAIMDWPRIQTGKPDDPARQATTSSGNGLMHPLHAAAKKAGVEILLDHRMISIHREGGRSSRVIGIAVDNKGRTLNIRANATRQPRTRRRKARHQRAT